MVRTMPVSPLPLGPSIRFGILSDIHAAPVTAEPYVWQNTVDLPHAVELLDAGLSWLAGQAIDTLVLLGDLTESADPACFAAVGQRALALGVPVLAVPGNCDVDLEERTLTAFTQLAAAGLTIAPAQLAGGIELVGLVGDAGSKRLAGTRAFPTADWRDAHIVFSHYPVLELEPDLIRAGFRHSGNLTNRAEIESALRGENRPTVVIHGHLHVHDARISGSLLHLSCAALVEPPHHVAVIEITMEPDSVDPERFVVERRAHAVRSDAVDRLPVFAPLHQRWEWHGGQWTSVSIEELSNERREELLAPACVPQKSLPRVRSA